MTYIGISTSSCLFPYFDAQVWIASLNHGYRNTFVTLKKWFYVIIKEWTSRLRSWWTYLLREFQNNWPDFSFYGLRYFGWLLPALNDPEYLSWKKMDYSDNPKLELLIDASICSMTNWNIENSGWSQNLEPYKKIRCWCETEHAQKNIPEE